VARVHVQVPATTANLGAGFDVLGLALALYNEIELSTTERPTIEIEGLGADELPRDDRNLVRRAIARLAAELGREAPVLGVRQVNRIPLERGLGSSAAAIVGGLVGASALLGWNPPEEVLLRVAVEVEGHPDNVVPALRGGVTVSYRAEEAWRYIRLEPPPELRVALAVPEYTVSTERARALLPPEVPRQDALFNVSRSALFVAALASGDLRHLGAAMEDRLHQPYRARLVPGMQGAIEAALRAGAWGAALSGAGPTIVALASDAAPAAAEAMAHALAQEGVRAEAYVLKPDLTGAEVRATDPTN